MNKIKNLRTSAKLTQSQLAEKTGLSLRTIQRAETGSTVPKGHTLKVLHDFFKDDTLIELIVNDNVSSILKKINFSALLFIFLPFIHVIIIFLIWRNYKSSQTINEAGRQIINFQILWSICYLFSIIVSSFIQANYLNNFRLILLVLLLGTILNIIMILRTGKRIHDKDLNLFSTKFRLM